MNTHLHTFALEHPNFSGQVFIQVHICLRAPPSPTHTHTHSGVQGGHVSHSCTACLHADEDSIGAHAHSHTHPPHWQDAKEWGKLHEKFTNRPRWSRLEAEWRTAVGRQAGGREFQRGTRSVWCMILYSEIGFTIPPLSRDQSHRGFLQASATPAILHAALR